MSDTFWLCFGSLLSTIVGLVLFYFSKGQKLLDSFMITVGRSVYALNRFGVDDLEHLRVTQKNALRICAKLAALIAYFAVLIAASLIPLMFLARGARISSGVLLAMIVCALPPYMVYYRLTRRGDQQDYPPSKQLFYYVTLGVPCVGHSLHRLEYSLGRCESQLAPVLIVSGLARAGTTALLHQLHELPQLWSLTYRCMPFPMASGGWLRINRAKAQPRERSHQDGIQIDLDSPEAFDEYFWRVILEESYYGDGWLKSHDLDEHHVRQYEKYVLTSLPRDRTYLTKNNNFLLRAGPYLAQRPQDLLLLVYRHPIQHAASLLRQQRIQSEYQARQPFALDYMDMLGHHEFGRHRRDFVFPDTCFRFHEPSDINHWLERWIDYYKHARLLPNQRIRFVDNASIRQDPATLIQQVADQLGLEASPEAMPSGRQHTSVQATEDFGPIDPQLESESAALYRELVNVGNPS